MASTRRQFVQRVLSLAGVVSFSPTVPGFLWRTAAAATLKRDPDATVLVVVQLTGGNDGLNTVVPYDDDHYARSRPTIRFTKREVWPIPGSDLGFHPQMRAFRELYDDGLLSVVQGVGYPNSSRQHGSAMRDWQTARPGQAEERTGWLGRLLDLHPLPGQALLPAALVSPIALPQAFYAKTTVVPSVRSLADWTFRTLPAETSDQRRQFLLRAASELDRPSSSASRVASRRPGPQARAVAPAAAVAPFGFVQASSGVARSSRREPELPNPLLELVRQTLSAACEISRRVDQRLSRVQHGRGVSYPEFGLAQRLKTIAELLRADLGTRIFFTELGGEGFGGFDNHANQRGNHGVLLHELAESFAAFLKDLRRDGLADRVLLMTFSEFGRTVRENGRRGTDHGAAAPMFLAGGKLRGGLVGEHPSLSDLDNNALRFHTDFRQVYATVLEKWLGVDSEPVLGRRFRTLDLFA